MAEVVHPTGTYVLGGVSFGGMVATEMARHLRPHALLLIASAPTGSAISADRRFLVQTGLRLGAFVQWGLEALARWKPTFTIAAPVYHIHGAADRLIPSRRVRATAVVSGGGHLINVTHADQVNAFVRRVLDRESPASAGNV